MHIIGDMVYVSGDQFHGLYTKQAHPGEGDEHGVGVATSTVAYKAYSEYSDSWEHCCYVGGNDGVAVLDVSSGTPSTVGTLLSGVPVNGVSLSDTELLVVSCNADGETDPRVYFFDVGYRPTNPPQRGYLELAAGTAENARVFGNRLYVAAGTAGFKVYSIATSGIGTPSHLGSFTTAGPALDVVVKKAADKTFAYIAEGASGLEIVRIFDTNPFSLSLKGQFDNGSVGYARRLWVSGQRVYVADGEAGVEVIDVSSPTSPSRDAQITGGDVLDVKGTGRDLYFLDESLLKVYDRDDPGSPTRRGWLNSSATVKALDLTNRVWVADDEVLQAGLLQEGSVPTVLETTFNLEYDVQLNWMTWVFTWRTDEWTDPELLKVVIADGEFQEQDCTRYGAGTTLTAESGGVETFVYPAIEGGYWNVLRYDAGACAAQCDYLFVGKCAIFDADDCEVETTETEFTIEYCVQ
jgi:hypothetical protein